MIPCKNRTTQWVNAEFFIVKATGPAIFGLPTCRDLQLLTLHCSVKENDVGDKPVNTLADLLGTYPDQFDNIGNFPGQYRIMVDPNAPPVIHAPRRCPIQMIDEVKSELDIMLSRASFGRSTNLQTGSVASPTCRKQMVN